MNGGLQRVGSHDAAQLLRLFERGHSVPDLRVFHKHRSCSENKTPLAVFAPMGLLGPTILPV